MDSYTRTARLYPALLALLPVSVAVVVLFDPSEWFRSLLLLAGAAGVHLILMRLVRNLGERRQAAWWKRIGGNPTALRLRWSAASHDDDHRDLHRRVEAFTGVDLPSRAREEVDQAAADRIYHRAVARLRELTRDHGLYPRVWDELKNYGFARNSYGARPLGIAVGVVVLLVTAILTYLNLHQAISIDWWKLWVVGGVSVAAIIFWPIGARFAYVERESDRYIAALLDAPPQPKV